MSAKTDNKHLLQTRVPRDTFRFVSSAATADGISNSAWLRRLVLAAAKKGEKA